MTVANPSSREAFEMNGQWIGTYDGSSQGTISANIDESPSHYQGVVYLWDAALNMPASAAYFRTADKRGTFSFRTIKIYPVHPKLGTIDSWDNVKQFYPEDVNMSRYGDVTGTWDEDSLKFSWATDIGVQGQCTLSRPDATRPSEIQSEPLTWDTYRASSGSRRDRRFLFRGQEQPWRLRTSFHRTGRANLTLFIESDVPALHRHLSARTRHVFNLEVPQENGAFFNLIQHHGYPTPLLDWTRSPYVAAFFAYHKIAQERVSEATDEDKVRLLLFDYEAWRNDFLQVLNVLNAHLHVSVCEFLAIENERMIPQQAVSTLTNIDDIETFVQLREHQNDKRYLQAIDLPVKERNRVMEDLRQMGITAGSLFPGIDGTCEELRERNFNT